MSEWCKELHGKVSYHVILCASDKQNLGLNIIFLKKVLYTLKSAMTSPDAFCTLAFLLGFEKNQFLIGTWAVFCTRLCQIKDFIPDVMCLSQDWPRLYKTVKSPWNKLSTTSCHLSDSTLPLDSVPLLVSSSRRQMITSLGWFVTYVPLILTSAGNSVHADKRFLDKYMPQFMYHLHYRIIDVSTIKELCRPVFLNCCANLTPLLFLLNQLPFSGDDKWRGRPGYWIFHLIYIILMTIHCLKVIHRTQVVRLLGWEKQTNSYMDTWYMYLKSETQKLGPDHIFL